MSKELVAVMKKEVDVTKNVSLIYCTNYKAASSQAKGYFVQIVVCMVLAMSGPRKFHDFKKFRSVERNTSDLVEKAYSTAAHCLLGKALRVSTHA